MGWWNYPTEVVDRPSFDRLRMKVLVDEIDSKIKMRLPCSTGGGLHYAPEFWNHGKAEWRNRKTAVG